MNNEFLGISCVNSDYLNESEFCTNFQNLEKYCANMPAADLIKTLYNLLENRIAFYTCPNGEILEFKAVYKK